MSLSFFSTRSGIFGISYIFAVSKSSLSHTDMRLSLDCLCSVIKMNNAHTRAQIHKHRQGNVYVNPQESAAHVVILFYERCPGTVGGDKLYVCVMSL